jgi:hypothetical protein
MVDHLQTKSQEQKRNDRGKGRTPLRFGHGVRGCGGADFNRRPLGYAI